MLSSAQFRFVEAAINDLPAPLRQSLLRPDIYRLAGSGPSPAAGTAPDRIWLDPALLADGAGSATALRRQILTPFFQRDFAHLLLRCRDRADCPALAVQQARLAHLFRGNYLHPAAQADAASAATSLADAYAFHAAAYFVDATYRCRHPLIAMTLESVWQLAGATATCSGPVPFLVSESSKPNALRWIDPARVYALHLQFAGEAGSTMSRFGHISLRLVLCNKDRVRVDRECEKDIFDHISLGFKANIDELDLSVWKGVAGGYPLKLYAQAFMDSYREYTIDEFRPLYSLPLVLREGDKRLLVAALSEVHWSYRNDYKFFTQNCATEVQWLLNAFLASQQPADGDFFPTERLRPDRLFRDARTSKHFDGAVLANDADAERNGYYFPSAEKYYQLAVDAIMAKLVASDTAMVLTPEAWREQAAGYRREHWLRPAISAASARADRRTANAGLVLEEWVAGNLRRSALASLMAYYGTIFQALAADGALLEPAERRTLLGCVNALQTSDSAGMHAEGIPQDGRAIDVSQACDVSNADLANLMKKLFHAFPPTTQQQALIAELAATVENIREVATAAGMPSRQESSSLSISPSVQTK